MNEEASEKKKGRGTRTLERQHTISQIRDLVGKFYSDEKIAEKLKLKPETLTLYKQEIWETDRHHFERISKFSLFSDYVGRTFNTIKELDYAATYCRDKGLGQAMVTAICKKQEFNKQVLDVAQDLGFVDKGTSEIKFSSEFSFSTMSDVEVETEIKRELEKMNKILHSKIEIRPEVAQFMDEDVKKNLPSHVVLLPEEEPPQKISGKVKFIERKRI